jgi:hypothetical protein
MANDKQATLEAARELYQIAFHVNHQFANVINSMMDRGDPPERYAPFINDHAAQTQTLTKLLYMIGTWEETWSE